MPGTTQTPSAIAHPGSTTSQSNAGITVVEPRWYSVIALCVSVAALAFSWAAWQARDASDARWQQSQALALSVWEKSQRDSEEKYHQSVRATSAWQAEQIRDADARWQQSYKTLEREARLAQLKQDDLRVALLAQGIQTNKHAASDSP
jgi:hypothetical protein